MRLQEIKGKINNKKIAELLNSHRIENYTIRSNGLIDVDGDVFFRTINDKFPIKFGNVTGSFNCIVSKKLTTLEGSPKSVGIDFDCGRCIITNLRGSPTKVGYYFDCSFNEHLVSLEGAPNIVGRDFIATMCPNLRIILPLLRSTQIGGTFYIDDDKVGAILNKYLKSRDILGCQEELIEAGFEEYARIK